MSTPAGGEGAMTPSRADRAPGSPQVAAGAGVGVGAGASNVSSSASPSPKKKSVTIASPRQSPASVSSPRLTEEELSRRAMERMRRASVMVAAKRAVGSISTTAHAAARLKTAAAIRMAEKKEDEERAMKKKKQGGAAGAAASGGSETAEDGQSPAGDAVPVKQRVLGYVMKGLDTATYFACNPGFVARAIRFLLLIIAVHLLAYWGWGLSLTLGLALVFFYNGWHSENVRLEKERKVMQQHFEESLDFRQLKNLPEWLVYPSAEKADWLNHLLSTLWPKMKEAIAESIRLSLQPTLDLYRPGFLSKLGVDKLDLGSHPIRITGVSKYDTEMEGAMLDLNVEWKGNPHIVVGVGAGMIYLPIELLNLTFAARLRLCFTHLTQDWPCFGAISISFVGKPDIDFSLKAAKMDIMSIPGVGSWLEGFIKDTLVWLMVWPTVMHIPILEGEQYLEDVSPGAGGYGFLQVVLVSSKGLKKTASPYCEITLTNSPGGREKNTRLTDTAEYIPAKEAHVWDGGQMFNLSVTDPFTQKVEVKLIDKKAMRKDLHKGTCVFEIHDLEPNTNVTLTQDAVPHDRANVTIQLNYMPFVKNEDPAGKVEEEDGRPHAASMDGDLKTRMRAKSIANDDNRPIGALNITLHKATNLPRMDRFGKSDPYCVLSCGKRSWKSTVKKKTLDPEWQEDCTLVVLQTQGEMLLLEMFDHDDVGKDDFMGRVRISLEDDILETGRIQNREFELEDAKKGSVTLSVRFREL